MGWSLYWSFFQECNIILHYFYSHNILIPSPNRKRANLSTMSFIVDFPISRATCILSTTSKPKSVQFSSTSQSLRTSWAKWIVVLFKARILWVSPCYYTSHSSYEKEASTSWIMWLQIYWSYWHYWDWTSHSRRQWNEDTTDSKDCSDCCPRRAKETSYEVRIRPIQDCLYFPPVHEGVCRASTGGCMYQSYWSVGPQVNRSGHHTFFF